AGGIDVSPTSGSFRVGSPLPGTINRGLPSCTVVGQTQDLTLRATAPGSSVVVFDLHTTGGTALPPVVFDVHATG
ncbi:MAG TPA: hypothetical protein VG074_10845, partial [Acidimicrobiales bacterium]|nr:hypothetical protein [Acidimicrobiales bacterium]